MKYSAAAFIAAVSLSNLAVANAQESVYFMNLHKLINLCNSKNKTEVKYCKYYIIGVHDALMNFNRINDHSKTMRKCIERKYSIDNVTKKLVDLQPITREMKEANKKLPAPNGVVATFGIQCTDQSEKRRNIIKQIGPEPKGDKSDIKIYRIIYSCMYLLEKTKRECIDMLE